MANSLGFIQEVKSSNLSHVLGFPQRRLPLGGDKGVFLQQLLHPCQACPLKSCQDQAQQEVASF